MLEGMSRPSIHVLNVLNTLSVNRCLQVSTAGDHRHLHLVALMGIGHLTLLEK